MLIHKVKCDKRFPCSQCTRAKVQCIFRAPVPPRRGKRKPNEVNLLARLKRYEDMLQALGVTIESIKVDDDAGKDEANGNDNRTGPTWNGSNPSSSSNCGKSERNGPEGKLVADEYGKSMYLEK